MNKLKKNFALGEYEKHKNITEPLISIESGRKTVIDSHSCYGDLFFGKKMMSVNDYSDWIDGRHDAIVGVSSKEKSECYCDGYNFQYQLDQMRSCYE